MSSLQYRISHMDKWAISSYVFLFMFLLVHNIHISMYTLLYMLSVYSFQILILLVYECILSWIIQGRLDWVGCSVCMFVCVLHGKGLKGCLSLLLGFILTVNMCFLCVICLPLAQALCGLLRGQSQDISIWRLWMIQAGCVCVAGGWNLMVPLELLSSLSIFMLLLEEGGRVVRYNAGPDCSLCVR